MAEEFFDLVDEEDRIVGSARRSECHGNPALIHRAVHVLVFNPTGELLLQKRSPEKDIQPGKWDTSVGGHLDRGESYLNAARREMREELGVAGVPLTKLYHSRIRNEIEAENIVTYLCCHAGAIEHCPREIEQVRFWSAAEIDAVLGSGCFTPNFEEEWAMFRDWRRRYQAEPGERAFCGGERFADLFQALNSEES